MKQALLIISVLVVVSCKTPVPQVSIDHDSFECSFAGGTDTVIIDANYAWYASSTSASVTITPDHAGTDIPAIITVDKNIDGIEKELHVYFSAANMDGQVAQKLYTIKQTFDRPIISVSPASGSVGYVTDSLKFLLTSNYPWSAEVSDKNVTLSPSAGTAAETLEITAYIPDNAGLSVRNYSVVFTCMNNKEQAEATYTISQASGPQPSISITPSSKTVGPEEESFEVIISSVYPWGATVTEGISSLSKGSGRAGRDTTIVTVSPNKDASEKTHFVYFQSQIDQSVVADTLTIHATGPRVNSSSRNSLSEPRKKDKSNL